MAITFRSSEVGSGSAPSVTIDRPSGVVDGDLLIAAIAEDAANVSGTANANGFTCVASLDHGGDSLAGSLWWKIADSEPTTYTFSGATGEIIGSISAYYETSATSWNNDVSSVSQESGNTHNMPSIDSENDSLLFASFHNDSTSTITTHPESMDALTRAIGASQELAPYYQLITIGQAEAKSITWGTLDSGIVFGAVFTFVGGTLMQSGVRIEIEKFRRY